MKFGVLGDAKISRTKVIPAILSAGHEVVQIGRRDPATPSPDPMYQGIPQTSYDDVLANPDIDAIYNPLPNHLHVPMSVAALKAGKHVLCEKPVALNTAELDDLAKAIDASGCYFYEAYMIRHHPQWQWLKTADIGDAQIVHAMFTYPPRDHGNIRNRADYGGGPVYDIGCYAILAGLLIFGEPPIDIDIRFEMNPALDVEDMASGMLIWSGGRHLTFSVSSTSASMQSLLVTGTKGSARLHVPYNPPSKATGFLNKGQLGQDDVITFPDCDQYALMVEDFVHDVETKTRPNLTISKMVTSCLEQMIIKRNTK